jgi:hypothetical protein
VTGTTLKDTSGSQGEISGRLEKREEEATTHEQQ